MNKKIFWQEEYTTITCTFEQASLSRTFSAQQNLLIQNEFLSAWPHPEVVESDIVIQNKHSKFH